MPIKVTSAKVELAISPSFPFLAQLMSTFLRIENMMMCAGGEEDKDTCQGKQRYMPRYTQRYMPSYIQRYMPK